jgi:hypothetical protein
MYYASPILEKRKNMRLINKLSVISLAVLMFSFINTAHAACQGSMVNNCNQSTTQSSCINTFRKTPPQLQCAWDGKTCRANGAACDSQNIPDGGTCTDNGDCVRGLYCVAGACESPNGKKHYDQEKNK